MRIFPQNKTSRVVKAKAEWCFKDKRVISRVLLLRNSSLMAASFFFSLPLLTLLLEPEFTEFMAVKSCLQTHFCDVVYGSWVR